MDQFATGLVGTRSPHGACSSVFSPEHISGGSSSGSAVAVAQGLVTFALGTDTAGSGRVPAALNGIVGLKPTPGLISTTGVVPACRTLDCVSIFAETCADAALVFDVAHAFDPADPYSRELDHPTYDFGTSHGFLFGVPQPAQLEFFGDDASARAYAEAVAALEALGGEKIYIDLDPFRAAANLLYPGPWLAERIAAIDAYHPDFLTTHAAEMDPTVHAVISSAAHFTAADAFRGAYQLEGLRRQTAAVWEEIDFLFLPTVPRTYTHAEIAASPIDRNATLGYYTNFVNLLDLAAVAVPAGLKGGVAEPGTALADGSKAFPFGASLIGPPGTDLALLQLGDWLHRALNITIAAGPRLLAATPPLEAAAPAPTHLPLVVVGAHLSGQPLNSQLTDRGATLLAATRTAPHYRLYALANTSPPKPGLVYDPALEPAGGAALEPAGGPALEPAGGPALEPTGGPGQNGPGIEVELWDLPIEEVGSFLALIPPPLTLGTLRLASGQMAKGFLCEPFAVADATEITHLGGWRAYLASRG